jgi:hypothetical protein
MTAAALDAKARRVARKVGLVAYKSRWRVGTIDNYGEYMLVDPHTNIPAAGFRWSMSAQEVIEYCNGQPQVTVD